MPDGDPWFIKLLDRLGVNTTRLRWRLHQREQQARRILDGEAQAPLPLPSWWRYPNKICSHCRAVNHRTSTVCDSCGRRLPTMWGYRIRRIVLGTLPSDGPVVSMSFLAVMVAVWVAQIALDGVSLSSLMGPSREAIHVLGAFSPAAVEVREYWRLLAFGLVHGGLFHIGMNSYFLVQIGPALESQLSRARMLALITLSQLTAGLTVWLWNGEVQRMWYTPTVGASGWLFGLLGFGIVFAHRAGLQPMRDSLLRSALFMFILGFIINSYGGGISNSGHFGGMLGGLLFGVLPEGRRRNRIINDRSWNAVGVLSLALWIATLAFMVKCVVTVWPQILQAN